MPFARPRASLRALSALVMASLLLALSTTTAATAAGAAEDEQRAEVLDRIQLLETQRRAATPVQAATAAGAGGCASDAAGDVIDIATGSRTTTGNEDAADLLEQCANYGPSLSLTVQVAAPKHPRLDPAWLGATAILWAIDTTSDGKADYFADYSLDANATLRGTVVNAASKAVACTPRATFTGLHGLSGITRSCLGGASTVAVAAAAFYDTSTPSKDGPVLFDQAPDAGRLHTVPAGGTPRMTGRLAGSTRFDTSVAISKLAFPQGADVVYLARAFDVLVDAVAGGALTDGPILLVPRCGEVPTSITAEISRLGPNQVVALGGKGAVCDATLTQAAGGRPTDRIAGSDRFSTAAAISKRAFPKGESHVYIARGDVVADAIAGGVLTDGPILLVPSTGVLPDAVATELARVNPQLVVALGGTGAVSDGVLHAAARSGSARSARLAGSNRIDTALQISAHQFPGTAPEVYLARADVFADALVGGALTGGPILLVPSCADFAKATGAAAAQLDTIRAELSRLSPDTAYALGGTSAVCNAWLTQAAQA
jgi:hypothetical protein